MEGAAGSVSDQKDGEDASGSDKIAGSGSDEKAMDQRPLVPSRSLSADSPAFIPRRYLLAPQGRVDSTPVGKTGGGTVSQPSPAETPSTVIASVHSPSPTTRNDSSGSTSERWRNHASPLPEKGLSSSPTSSGSTGQIRAAAPPRKGYASSPISSASSGSTGERRPIPDSTPTRKVQTPPTGSTGEGRPIPASTPTSKGQAPTTGAANNDRHPRRRGSNSPDPALLPRKNLGPHFQDPPPSRPQVPAYSAVLQHGPGTLQEMVKNKNDMLKYLNHKDCGHNKDQASKLGRQLTVDFNDMTWKDSNLAENICNRRGCNFYWLQDAAKSFFEDNGLPSDNVSFDFKDMPSWLRQAKDYMGTQPCLQQRSICGGIASIDEATPHGRRGADIILNGILDCVSRGISWSGKLTSEDLWFGEGPDGSIRLYIATQPTHTANAPTKDRILDVHDIWSALKGALNFVDGRLPLYFPELKRDLENARYLPPCFFTYLHFHPALYGSMPRRHVMTSLQKSVKCFKAALEELYNLVFSCRPRANGDWRQRADRGALKLLLNFRLMEKRPPNKKGEINATPESSTGKKKERGGQCDEFSQGVAGNITGTSDVAKTTGGSLGSVLLPSQSGEATLKSQQYPDTLYVDTRESLLVYVRNGLEHLDQYLAIEDEDEIEL